MKSILTEMMLVISNSFAASILFKVTLTTILTLIAVHLARRSRASVRHVLMAASFALMFVLPIASALAPPVHIAMPVTEREATAASSVSMALVELPRDAVQPQYSMEAPAASHLPRISVSTLLFGGWILGIVIFLGPVVVGLWQTRVLRRSSLPWREDRKSTRLNSSHSSISYAVFCLKKKM